jgi:hypothetical protein
LMDTNAVTATKSLTITVNASPLVTTASPMPAGTIGSAYSQTLTSSGGTTPLAWSLLSGSLPPGLTLGAGAATYSFTVKVLDTNGVFATKALTITT